MFEYIKGQLTETTPLKVTVDVQGLGYRLFIPLNNYADLPKLGHPVTLYVCTVIREDAHTLYGFLTREQRDLFEHLIEISGIGPKTALGLVGHMEIADFQLAISQSNISLLCKIPHVGKKTAERLVIEMRDKIGKTLFTRDTMTPLKAGAGVVSDAINALINLGYSLPVAQKAIKTALTEFKGEPEISKLLTSALRAI